VIVVIGVVTNQVTLGVNAAEEIGIGGGVPADDEERGRDPFALEHVEHGIGAAG
jgi:hypothetical protein